MNQPLHPGAKMTTMPVLDQRYVNVLKELSPNLAYSLATTYRHDPDKDLDDLLRFTSDGYRQELLGLGFIDGDVERPVVTSLFVALVECAWAVWDQTPGADRGFAIDENMFIDHLHSVQL